MIYPMVAEKVQLARIKRSIQQMRVGDIVDAWLDCQPAPGRSRPLPIIIIALPELNSDIFLVKDIFGSDPYTTRFAYQWRIVGHINGYEEIAAAELAYYPYYLGENKGVSDFSKYTGFPR